MKIHNKIINGNCTLMHFLKKKTKKIEDGNDLNKSKHFILTKKINNNNNKHVDALVFTWFNFNPGLPNNLDF
jgi:hypothetical protein